MIKEINKYHLIHGDCLEKMKLIPDNFVNLIACDLPYGTTQNKWDIVIPFDKLWEEYKRILVSNGIVVLTATQPFTSLAVVSNLDMFKYDLIWEKTISSGQLNVKRQPLRNHESILIFAGKNSIYNEQKTIGEPYKINRKVNFLGEGYGKQSDSSKINTGYRHAKSVIKISNPRIKGGHPTQKPEELMDFVIKTYSNKDDIVLDNCMGVGTTGVSALKLERKFIGIELNEQYFEKARLKISQI